MPVTAIIQYRLLNEEFIGHKNNRGPICIRVKENEVKTTGSNEHNSTKEIEDLELFAFFYLSRIKERSSR